MPSLAVGASSLSSAACAVVGVLERSASLVFRLLGVFSVFRVGCFGWRCSGLPRGGLFFVLGCLFPGSGPVLFVFVCPGAFLSLVFGPGLGPGLGRGGFPIVKSFPRKNKKKKKNADRCPGDGRRGVLPGLVARL